jgi:hypothetical protein
MTTSVSSVTIATAITTTAVVVRVDWGWTIARIRWLLATWVLSNMTTLTRCHCNAWGNLSSFS